MFESQAIHNTTGVHKSHRSNAVGSLAWALEQINCNACACIQLTMLTVLDDQNQRVASSNNADQRDQIVVPRHLRHHLRFRQHFPPGFWRRLGINYRLCRNDKLWGSPTVRFIKHSFPHLCIMHVCRHINCARVSMNRSTTLSATSARGDVWFDMVRAPLTSGFKETQKRKKKMPRNKKKRTRVCQ